MICDHTSVGMFVWKKNKLLLIERNNLPYGYAVPAGHVDQDPSFEAAATRELREETGLIATSLKLIGQGRKETPCKREDGSWHYWKLYDAIIEPEYDMQETTNPHEVKKIIWCSREEIIVLASKTQQYIKGDITEDAWRKDPGLEVVMYEWFKELYII